MPLRHLLDLDWRELLWAAEQGGVACHGLKKDRRLHLIFEIPHSTEPSPAGLSAARALSQIFETEENAREEIVDFLFDGGSRPS